MKRGRGPSVNDEYGAGVGFVASTQVALGVGLVALRVRGSRGPGTSKKSRTVRFNSMFPNHGVTAFIMTKATDAFSTAMAAKIAGVKKTTLENWIQRGILSPSLPSSGTTHPRQYAFRDLVAIRVLVVLRDAGIDLGGLHRIVDYLKKSKSLSATDALASTLLVTDGHDVYEVEDNVPISAYRKPGQVVLHVIQLGTLVRQVHDEARKVTAAA